MTYKVQFKSKIPILCAFASGNIIPKNLIAINTDIMADRTTGRVNKANTSTSAKTTYLQEHHHFYRFYSFKLPKNDYRITDEETYLQDAPLQRTYNNVESYDKN